MTRNKIEGPRDWMNFWITLETKDWIRAKAAEQRVTMSDICREIVEKARAREEKRAK